MQTGGLNGALESILAHYGEPYDLRRDTLLDGAPVAATAMLVSEEERTLLGVRLSRGKKPPATSTARGLVLFLLEPVFDGAAAGRALSAVQTLERLNPPATPDHSFTFYDAVILTGRTPDADAAKAVRRFRLRWEYSAGWGLARVAVVDVTARRAVCSKDAKELGRMTLARLG